MAEDDPTRPSLDDIHTLAIDPRETFQPGKSELLGRVSGKPVEEGKTAPEPAPPPASFSLRKVVGRGGMGEVWEATQLSLDRTVAVKRVRKDLGSSLTVPELASMSRMFTEEALTTAFLDHPNIVAVHDLIFDESGEPLLAMKLVKGRPWNEMIREDFSTLEPGAYLARHIPVLIAVSQAVAFAHSQGIVHRDLKPSQVMVGEFGEVLLMDWGLAISLSQRKDKRSHPFAPGRGEAPNPAGTFAFMAPEQTEDSADGIGPWTDVFLLGATLYSLVTGGCSPHEGAGLPELLEAARRCEVVPPEKRVPGRELPGELSALCQWAMRKNPSERLPSALDFVRELQEYLTGARKKRESTELTKAVASELRAKTPDYTALSDFEAQLMRAEGLWPENQDASRLRQVVLEMYARRALENGDLVLAGIQARRLAAEEVREQVLGGVEARRAALVRTRRQRAAFLGTAVVAAALLLGLGVKYTADQARARRQIAAERDRANAARLDAEGLIAFMLGDLKKKLDPIGRLDVLDEVGKRALTYFDGLPESDRSSSALAKRAETLRQIAEIRLDQGDPKGAAVLLEEARGICRELLGRSPAEPAWLRLEADLRLASSSVQRSEGKLGDALLEAEGGTRTLETLVAGSADPSVPLSLLRAYSQTALLKRIAGNLDGALLESKKAAALASALLQKNPSNPEWLDALASCHARMGGVHRMKGDAKSALAEYDECGAVLARRLSLDPADTRVQAEIAANHSHRGAVLVAAGRLDEALAENLEHLGIMRDLAGIDPGNTSWRQELGVGHATVARVLRARGDLAGARKELREEEAILRGLLRMKPSNASWKRGLGANLLAQASALFLGGETGEAAVLLAAAGPLVSDAAEKAPGDQQAQRFLGQFLLLRGRVAQGQGNRESAREDIERAAAVLSPLVERSKDVLFVVPYAQALVLLGRKDEALPLVADAVGRGFGDRYEMEFFRKNGLALQR